MTRNGPIAVVSEEYNADNVPMRNAWVGKLLDERDISRVIGKIVKIFPSMSHLKRCSSKRILLGFAPFSTNHDNTKTEKSETRLNLTCLTRHEVEKLLAKADFDLTLFENSEINVIEVAALAPRTKTQAARASLKWPLNFHPDPKLESILDGTCFDSEQLRVIDRCTRLCIEVALRGKARGTNECHGSAVVYDPRADRIVAIAASRLDLHPMWHATIIAVDLVARLGSGGAYRELTHDDSHNGKSKYPRLDDKGESFPLSFPAELAELARRWPYNDIRPFYTYLCTDYWIFLLREPCSLCAMALLHSRISNIFYGIANETRGVLGSRAMLHEIPGLNHRYGVWKGVREAECLAALIEIQSTEEGTV